MKREQFLLCTPLTERSSITDKDWYQQNMLCNKAYSTIWYLRFDQKMMLLLILIVIPYSTCSMRYAVKRPWTVRCPLSVQPLRESYESGPSWLLSTRLPTYHTIPSWLRWPGGYLCGVQKQSSKSDRSHRTCSGDLCLFGLGVKSTKTKYDCHVATSSTITRTTMTHQNFSAISGEPTLQHAHCPYGNCACVWFGTNHHLRRQKLVWLLPVGTTWITMILHDRYDKWITTDSYLLLGAGPTNLAWKKRKNTSGNLVSRRATNHEL